MKDPLYGNKVAAAVLIVALLAIGLPVVVGTFTELSEHAAHHGDEEAAIDGCPDGLVYAPFECGEIGDAGGDAGGEAAVPWVNVLAAADPERGARSAAICSSCHSFDQGGPNGTGPNLWEVVGRPVASVSGYAYSAALKAHGGEWDYETLDPYLENSQGYVPGTQMAQKIRKDEKRADIIAYLGTLAASPVPLPEPVAVEEPPAEGETPNGEAPGEETDGDTAMDEAGEAAADTIDFEAAEPGEAVNTDRSEVNDPGDDGFPGDPAKDGSNYRSSDEDAPDAQGQGAEGQGGAEGGQDAQPTGGAGQGGAQGQGEAQGQDQAEGQGQPDDPTIQDDGFRPQGSGLPNEAAAEESEQRSAPDEPDGSDE